jgi:hypothetical protein
VNWKRRARGEQTTPLIEKKIELTKKRKQVDSLGKNLLIDEGTGVGQLGKRRAQVSSGSRVVVAAMQPRQPP